LSQEPFRRSEGMKADTCFCCGDLLVEIRGKYPGEPKRKICATCAYERLETIHEMTDKNYGQASQR